MALAADKSISRSEGVSRSFGVGATEVIYHGAIVALNATGFACAATGAVDEQVIGVNEGDVADNSAGADGAIDVVVGSGAVYGPFVNSVAHPLATVNLGRLCYAEDDETAGAVAAIPGCVLGYLDRIETEGVYVFIPQATMLGAHIPGDLIVAGTIQGGSTITAATGLVATTGGVEATAGDITAVADDIVATAGDIVATAGDIYATAGQIRAQAAVTGGIVGQYHDEATGAVPTQAQMVAAFGPGVDGQTAMFNDTTASQPYLCGFSTVEGGWWYLAFTAVGGP